MNKINVREITFNCKETAMQSTSSKVTSKGQIVIPKKIREKYGIRPSSSIHWIEKEEGILMVPDSDDPIISARGMLKGSGLLKAYLLDKKMEKERENKKTSIDE